jgi:hypothetical protein
MLELLEELAAKERKVFQQHVHMHELTTLSLNGSKGQALVLTNHYLYLIYTGFFKSACHKISADGLQKVESRGNMLWIKTAESNFILKMPPQKVSLLPQVVQRIDQWLSGTSAAINP